MACLHGGNLRKLCLNDECITCLSKSVAGASASLAERGIAYAESNIVSARQTFLQCNNKRIWTCTKPECAHIFDAACNGVCSGRPTGCPFCSNQKLCENADCMPCLSKSVAGAAALLSARSIVYAATNTVLARQTFLSSGHKRLWTCSKPDCAHSWDATCSHVCGGDPRGCPFCSNPPNQLCKNADCVSCFLKSVAGASALLQERGIVYAATNTVSARQTFLQCNKNRIWTCTKPECAHSWNATCNDVCGKQQSGCPFCSNSKLCENADCVPCLSKSVAGASASLFGRSIVYATTNTVSAQQTFLSSHQKRLWTCLKLECAHSWDATCAHVCGGQPTGCPFCSNPPKQLCENRKECVLCLSKSVAGASASLFERSIVYAANNAVSARQTFLQCNNMRIWTCTKPECAHSWNATCNSVCGGIQSGCPFCSNPPQQLCENNECITCLSKSVAGARFSLIERSIVYAATNKQTARQTFLSSGQNRWWTCTKPECAHSWDATCCNVLGENQSGCPFCSNTQLCENADCVSCLSKSVVGAFAVLAERGIVYATTNTISARQTFLSSGYKRTFTCTNPECAHNWDAACSSVCGGMQQGCPYCSNPPKQLCVNADCVSCLSKSVASASASLLERNIVYAESNTVSARQTFLSSGQKRTFTCTQPECAHSWDARCAHVCGGGLQSGCPFCRHKTEALVRDTIESWGYVVKSGRVSWCINPETGRLLPFDMLVLVRKPDLDSDAEYKIIVEVDGDRHFTCFSTPGRGTNSSMIAIQADIYKMARAQANGVPVIRICQEDVWNDRWPEWKVALRAALESLDKPEVSFLSSDLHLYDRHREAWANAQMQTQPVAFPTRAEREAAHALLDDDDDDETNEKEEEDEDECASTISGTKRKRNESLLCVQSTMLQELLNTL
jgi:hypothetical protein